QTRRGGAAGPCRATGCDGRCNRGGFRLIAADRAVQRPRDARLLVIDARGRFTPAWRGRCRDFMRRGDVVVANDAATLPASLPGIHVRSGSAIELRLAAWRGDARRPLSFDALLFGAGDYRTRTEARAAPAAVAPGDELALGALTARVLRTLGDPPLVRVRFDGTPAAFWRGVAAHGRAIQYAHLAEPLALWDAWTSIAAAPAACEPPSAGFMLGWADVAALPARGIGFATLTHAAGLPSTGDAQLDGPLPPHARYVR